MLPPHARPTWLPLIDQAATSLSWYGGEPLMQPDDRWPKTPDGEPMQFVLQLDVTTLPTAYSQALGRTGLVQLFYCASDWFPYEELEPARMLSAMACCRRIAREGAVAGAWPEKAPPPRDRHVIAGWQPRIDFPRSEEYVNYDPTLGLREAFDPGERFLADGDLAAHGITITPFERAQIDASLSEEENNVVQAKQGDKLGGWPFWTQSVETLRDRRGKPMRYVYQLDASCFYNGDEDPKAYSPRLFASDGTGHLFVSVDDPDELAFSWACG